MKVGSLDFRFIDYFKLINDSIIYIDLTMHDDKVIDNAFDSLSKYNKWILDLRGEVQTSELFLSLIYDNFFSSSQICTPYFTMPEKKLMSYHKESSIFYPAETKRLKGDFIFLIDWRTFGSGESFASTVKEYKIGKLIGDKTQGSLLSGVPIRLNSDFNVSLGTVYGYSPSGKSFLNSPISPDIAIEFIPESLNYDPALEEAINILSK